MLSIKITKPIPKGWVKVGKTTAKITIKVERTNWTKISKSSLKKI
jgi:hypothetical protein